MSACTKVAYPSEIEALKALREIRKEFAYRYLKRAYRCPDCEAWHLTKCGKTPPEQLETLRNIRAGLRRTQN